MLIVRKCCNSGQKILEVRGTSFQRERWKTKVSCMDTDILINNENRLKSTIKFRISITSNNVHGTQFHIRLSRSKQRNYDKKKYIYIYKCRLIDGKSMWETEKKKRKTQVWHEKKERAWELNSDWQLGEVHTERNVARSREYWLLHFSTDRDRRVFLEWWMYYLTFFNVQLNFCLNVPLARNERYPERQNSSVARGKNSIA